MEEVVTMFPSAPCEERGNPATLVTLLTFGPKKLLSTEGLTALVPAALESLIWVGR